MEEMENGTYEFHMTKGMEAPREKFISFYFSLCKPEMKAMFTHTLKFFKTFSQ